MIFEYPKAFTSKTHNISIILFCLNDVNKATDYKQQAINFYAMAKSKAINRKKYDAFILPIIDK